MTEVSPMDGATQGASSASDQQTVAWRDVADALELAAKVKQMRGERRIEFYDPYPYQRDFHRALDPQGNEAKQRLLMAANRVGKTYCGAAETAIHALGDYPTWWTGFRIQHPKLIWVGGPNNDKVRDICQKELLGEPHDPSAFGTGTIPKHRIVNVVRKAGVPNAVEAVVVKHKLGHNVTIVFKSYDAKPGDWMGEAVDFVWLDEEPSQAIFSQAVTRTVDTHGRLIMTFTPENGATEVVNAFLNNLQPGQQMYRATWDDALHLDEAAKAQIMSVIPEHEREMRTRGEPVLGSGLVFPWPDELISCDPLSGGIPKEWKRINGLDFGWDHPTACAFLAHDPDSDTIYVYDVYRASKMTPVLHAAAIKDRGDWIPVAWPRDGLQRDKGSGTGLAEQYRRAGLTSMLPEHFRNPPSADNPNGDESVERGLMEMLSRMQSGRFKVYRHLSEWFEEKRSYHRKDGVVVKLRDDLMAATRYGVMSLRYARKREYGQLVQDYGQTFDPLSY